jgi:hypothetical protein
MMPTVLDATLRSLAGIQQLGQGNLDMERTIAGTEALRQDTQQKAQQIRLNDEFMSTMRARMNAPDRPDPDTKSIATEDTNDGRNPERSVLRDLNAQKKSLQGEYAIAQQYGKNPKPYLDAIGHLDTQIREATKDAAQRTDKRAQETANILRDVDSQDSMNNAIKMINDNFGKKAAMEVYNAVPHDAEGMPIWNESAKKSLAPYVSRFTSMHEDAMQKYRAAEIVNQEKSQEERSRHDKATERERDQEIALRRNGQAQTQKRFEDRMKVAGLTYDRKAVRDTQNDLNKLAAESKIGDFKAAADFASGIESKLKDPAQGYVSVSPEDARQLVEQAKLMQRNFRSIGGGSKFQESEMTRMNSFLEKFEKYIGTVGEGEKILAKDQMLNLTGTMQSVYQNRNAELVKQELQRKKILADRGNNPEWVQGRGDIDSLKKSGRAAEVTVDSKSYLAIVPPGKTKKDLKKEDLFEIPQAPKVPSFLEDHAE